MSQFTPPVPERGERFRLLALARLVCLPWRRTTRLVICALLLAVAFTSGLLRASELGLPILRTYPRSEYKAHVQLHAPLPSPDGLMYFGNQLAVLEYDGRTWRILKVPLPYTRALALGPNGDLYLGDEDEIGVLARPD
ncbi:MAG TPA: hypothetical protein VHF69_06675, partial [Candidatus Synoicihabitans sp.]|nr:hypothetical protein [Candidatus Synoicihabitans sp.]